MVSVQWAAVRTNCGPTRLPPQNPTLSASASIGHILASQGYLLAWNRLRNKSNKMKYLVYLICSHDIDIMKTTFSIFSPPSTLLLSLSPSDFSTPQLHAPGGGSFLFVASEKKFKHWRMNPRDNLQFSNHTYDLFGASHAIPDTGSSVPYPVLYFIVHPLVHHGVQAAVSRRAGVGLVIGRYLTFAENPGHRVPDPIWPDLECRNYRVSQKKVGSQKI